MFIQLLDGRTQTSTWFSLLTELTPVPNDTSHVEDCWAQKNVSMTLKSLPHLTYKGIQRLKICTSTKALSVGIPLFRPYNIMEYKQGWPYLLHYFIGIHALEISHCRYQDTDEFSDQADPFCQLLSVFLSGRDIFYKCNSVEQKVLQEAFQSLTGFQKALEIYRWHLGLVVDFRIPEDSRLDDLLFLSFIAVFLTSQSKSYLVT